MTSNFFGILKNTIKYMFVKMHIAKQKRKMKDFCEIRLITHRILNLLYEK